MQKKIKVEKIGSDKNIVARDCCKYELKRNFDELNE
jgi:hypothetical protein